MVRSDERAVAGMNQQYITERWNVSKDDIYAALDALLVARIYVKYSVESNPRFQQVKNNDMKMVDSAIQKLKQYPNGVNDCKQSQ